MWWNELLILPLIITDVSSVFLSPTAFCEPYSHLRKEETKRMVQSYLLYLSDSLELLTNPGLQVSVTADLHLVNGGESDEISFSMIDFII